MTVNIEVHVDTSNDPDIYETGIPIEQWVNEMTERERHEVKLEAMNDLVAVRAVDSEGNFIP